MPTKINGTWQVLAKTMAILTAFFGMCWYTLAKVDKVQEDNNTLKTEVAVIKTNIGHILEGINDLKEAQGLPISKKSRRDENV